MASVPAGNNNAGGPSTVMIPRKKKKARKSAKSKRAKAAAAAEAEEEKTISFRNYAPSDAPEPPEGAAPKVSTAKEVEDQIERELQQSMVTNKDSAVSITAKSADWDLKRDVADKLKKLDRLTLRAIRDIVQERIAKEGGGAAGDDSSSSSSSDDDDGSSSGSDSDNDDA